jgi:hypothetical protein
MIILFYFVCTKFYDFSNYSGFLMVENIAALRVGGGGVVATKKPCNLFLEAQNEAFFNYQTPYPYIEKMDDSIHS